MLWAFVLGLMESMKQADMNNWTLNPEQFADLASSLNTFFTQTGLLQHSQQGATVNTDFLNSQNSSISNSSISHSGRCMFTGSGAVCLYCIVQSPVKWFWSSTSFVKYRHFCYLKFRKHCQCCIASVTGILFSLSLCLLSTQIANLKIKTKWKFVLL